MTGPILVTGAFGQVGRRCAELLLARGYAVIATDLRTDSVSPSQHALTCAQYPGTLRIEYADLRDTADVAGLLATHKPGVIIHLAAIFPPGSYRNPELARRVNVEGTINVVKAAQQLPSSPLLVFASSAAVYGSRNPYTYPGLITAETPVNPIDQYGENKILGEAAIVGSGLSYAVLRLGGVISPDGLGSLDSDHLVLTRATPTDNRLHTVDARDVALAFANAVDRRDTIEGKTLLIAGDDTHRHLQRDVEDDLLEAMGIGRLGPSAGLPGDPGDDEGWTFTGWFDTSESQALLDYQRRTWADTVRWVANSQSPLLRRALCVGGPALRPIMRWVQTLQRGIEKRGPYADPWQLIAQRYGPSVVADRGESP